jgi:ABC-type glycerol-3-phosphate transport system substrate-binding protein
MKRFLIRSLMLALAAVLTACATNERSEAAGSADPERKAGPKKCVPTTGSAICRDA